MVSKIIIPENVLASKALAIVDKPREAEVIQPYKRGTYTTQTKDGNNGMSGLSGSASGSSASASGSGGGTSGSSGGSSGSSTRPSGSSSRPSGGS
jgi:uncharacterized membrane protein YgcG